MHTSSTEYRRTLVRALRDVDVDYDLIVEVLHGLTRKESIYPVLFGADAGGDTPQPATPVYSGSSVVRAKAGAGMQGPRPHGCGDRAEAKRALPAWLHALDRDTARALLLAGFGSLEEVRTAFGRGDLADKLGANRIGAVEVWLARMSRLPASKAKPDMALN